MSDRESGVAVQPFDDDLDLITAYLQERLDPERVALVRQRLEEDDEFRHMAAPLIWAWQVPPRWEMEPVTREELEMRWDEFTKRAGFVHQKRKVRSRRLKLLGIVLLMLGTGAWFTREPVGAWYHDWRHFVAVSVFGEWVTVGKDVQVRLASGANFRVRRVPADTGTDVTKLAGAAEFRVQRERFNPRKATVRPFSIATSAGLVTSLRGTFSISTSGDTMLVDVRKPEVEERLGYLAVPTYVKVDNQRGDAVVLQEQQRARLVKNQPPEILP